MSEGFIGHGLDPALLGTGPVFRMSGVAQVRYMGPVGRWPVEYPGWFQGGMFDARRPGDEGYRWTFADYVVAASVIQSGGTEGLSLYVKEVW